MTALEGSEHKGVPVGEVDIDGGRGDADLARHGPKRQRLVVG
jgi:hypothetical protein